jgi:outer membrane protein TolC
MRNEKVEKDFSPRRRRWLPGVLCLFGLLSGMPSATAQTLLSLDSCRAMALRGNKQMSISAIKHDVATNLQKSARTKYLPHVSALGTYQFTSREVSILNDGQKSSLSNLGTNAAAGLQGIGGDLTARLGQIGQTLGQMGLPVEVFQQMAGDLHTQMGQAVTNTAGMLNAEGQKIVDAFRTDTRNIFAGTIMVTQPVYMGGAISTLNRMADIGVEMTENTADARRQSVIYATDQAYWQVVSLKHKQRLAQSFLDVVKKLDTDVQKMIEHGVATKSDGLSVSVKVNEAEMMLQKVNDGLVLSRMLLCKQIGLPLDTDIALADEDSENLVTATPATLPDRSQALDNRPEMRLLGNTVEMTKQTTRLLKAANLPQVALTGGYIVSNPNVFNGFQKKFGGLWNIGLLVRIPIWNWGDVAYKVRASKGATAIATLEKEEARELMELQVNQSSFKVDEAHKRLALAMSSTERAEENLRVANLGFQEGVITPAVVMEAQTAWLQALSQKIDAEIDIRMSQADLQKALGTLGTNP